MKIQNELLCINIVNRKEGERMGYGMLPMLLASDKEVDFSIHHLAGV